jgi:outer membrane protein assembly factor BamB
MNRPRRSHFRQPLKPALVALLAALALSGPPARGTNLLTNDWAIPLRSYSDSAPAVGTNGTIYFGTWRGDFWALNPDGTRKWVFRTGNEIKSAPAVALDGSVYFGCRDRKLYAVGENGKKRWTFQTGGWVDSSPALAHDGTVYFGSWDKSFYALNPDGTKKWQFKTPGEIVSSPAIGADGTIYFGSHDRKLYALAPDGIKKWEFTTGGPIISSPALNGDQCLYVTSVDGSLYAVNLDGKLRWRVHTGGMSETSPVIGLGGMVYVGVLEQLWAITPDGKKQWGRPIGKDTLVETSPVAFANGTVAYIAGSGLLYYVNPEGALQAMYWQCGCGYGSIAVGPTGAIYVADGNINEGGFTSLNAGVALAPSPWPKFRGNPRNTGNIQDAAP